ncbi:MAG: hypothetical protein ACRCVB_05120 [Cetobacterium sp.]|nr:hypothetical protein [Cetobacterium sp. ZOR0034]
MPEENIKELLKGKTIDELLDLIILGLEATDINNSVIQTFKDGNTLVETA